ncbi:MAG: hypothetical protein RIS52_281 [Pseudomonadota bacterium]
MEGAAATCQRVLAALAKLLPAWRNTKPVTPDFSAASANLRLAVRSSFFASPISRMAAPTAPHAIISAAARSAASSSGAWTITISSGLAPRSTSPGAYTPPCSRSFLSFTTHSRGLPITPARSASISAKPLALVTSFAITSCSAPRASPPPSRASRASAPSAKRPLPPWLRAGRARASMRRFTCARRKCESIIMFLMCSYNSFFVPPVKKDAEPLHFCKARATC